MALVSILCQRLCLCVPVFLFRHDSPHVHKPGASDSRGPRRVGLATNNQQQPTTGGWEGARHLRPEDSKPSVGHSLLGLFCCLLFLCLLFFTFLSSACLQVFKPTLQLHSHPLHLLSRANSHLVYILLVLHCILTLSAPIDSCMSTTIRTKFF